MREIILAPLTEGDLRQLISDSLRCQAEPTASLAQLVYEKTARNPFSPFSSSLHWLRKGYSLSTIAFGPRHPGGCTWRADRLDRA